LCSRDLLSTEFLTVRCSPLSVSFFELKANMVLITVLGLTTIISLSSADMNKGVRYTIANADDPTRAYSFRDSSSYFEVKTSAMNTTYGEVFWTMLPPVDLPQNIVSDWKDKYMAITGFEVDVRRIDEITGEEQSVPVFQSYNHHYGPAIHSSYATCLGPIGEDYGHGPTVLFDLNRNVSTPPPKGTRLVTNFVHGNGNEHRQVFHGVPSGYAQIVYSPSTFTITPMQINTNDGSGHRGASGPIPKFSQESANPNGHYSALLECPVRLFLSRCWALSRLSHTHTHTHNSVQLELKKRLEILQVSLLELVTSCRLHMLIVLPVRKRYFNNT